MVKKWSCVGIASLTPLLFIAGCDQGAGALAKRYEHRSELRLESETGGAKAQIFHFQLDKDIFSTCGGKTTDMRIFTIPGQAEVPHIVEKETRKKLESREVPCVSKITSAKTPGKNQMELVVELDKEEKGAPRVLHIRTKIVNFENRVSVFGSRDMKKWDKLASDCKIYDYSMWVELSSFRVPLDTKERYDFYKVSMSNFSRVVECPVKNLVRETRNGEEVSLREQSVVKEEVFKVDGIELRKIDDKSMAEKDVLREYPVETASVSGKTEIMLDTHFQPLTELVITSSTPCYSRNVSVEAYDAAADKFRLFGHGAILKITADKVMRDERVVVIPETRASRLKVRIHDYDEPPLRDLRVTARGPVYTASFVRGETSPPYSVCYSSKEKKKPVYNVARVLKEMGDAPRAMLTKSGLEKNPDYSTFSLWIPGGNHALTAALALMAAVLGWALFKGLKKAGEQETADKTKQTGGES